MMEVRERSGLLREECIEDRIERMYRTIGESIWMRLATLFNRESKISSG